eukprot:CAMPEP_0178898446 /NCGR_PEP_ID=MMETSP0786-20121207/2336_1 /TAXON_ID=186022 /ORGANISM="Thalassionema frauenfeldii, Strain CCMP 1798" /LENGTH=96 /DNA_ID=CAMNT_0020569167 /DNA_START=158 /DNA_END=444 /DNA_ORIENTATION=-
MADEAGDAPVRRKWNNGPERCLKYDFGAFAVESLRVAVAFHYMFPFNKCLNAFFFSPRDFDRLGYGQLGCSGFIIIDFDGYFVSKRTKAFLDYGEM